MKNKSFILGLVSAVFACNLVFTSCSEPKEVEKVTFLEKRVFTAEDSVIDLYARTKGDAHSGSYFSRTDSTNQYGIGTTFTLADSCVNKDIRIKINLWARSSKASPDCVYALGLYDGTNLISWNEIKLNKHIVAENKWVNVIDSLTIPGAQVTKGGMVITAFTFNTQKQIVLDSDDLEISLMSVSKELEE